MCSSWTAQSRTPHATGPTHPHRWASSQGRTLPSPRTTEDKGAGSGIPWRPQPRGRTAPYCSIPAPPSPRLRHPGARMWVRLTEGTPACVQGKDPRYQILGAHNAPPTHHERRGLGGQGQCGMHRQRGARGAEPASDWEGTPMLGVRPESGPHPGAPWCPGESEPRCALTQHPGPAVAAWRPGQAPFGGLKALLVQKVAGPATGSVAQKVSSPVGTRDRHRGAWAAAARRGGHHFPRSPTGSDAAPAPTFPSTQKAPPAQVHSQGPNRPDPVSEGGPSRLGLTAEKPGDTPEPPSSPVLWRRATRRLMPRRIRRLLPSGGTRSPDTR